jgi:hypothetical protein
MVVRVADEETRELIVASLEEARERRNQRSPFKRRDVEAAPTRVERFDSMLDLADTVTLPDGFNADADESELTPDERLAPYGEAAGAQGTSERGEAPNHRTSPDEIIAALPDPTVGDRFVARSMPRGSAELAPQRAKTRRRRSDRAEQGASRRISSRDPSPTRAERPGTAPSHHLRRRLVVMAALCVLAAGAILHFTPTAPLSSASPSTASTAIEDPFIAGTSVDVLVWGSSVVHARRQVTTKRVVARRRSHPVRTKRPRLKSHPNARKRAVHIQHSVASAPATAAPPASTGSVTSHTAVPPASTGSVTSHTAVPPASTRSVTSHTAVPPASTRSVTSHTTVAPKTPKTSSATTPSGTTKPVTTKPSTTECRGAGVLSATSCGRPSL